MAEEDYMGDLSQFISLQDSLPPKSSSQKVSNGKTLNAKQQSCSSNTRKAKFPNWQEHRKIKREQKQHEEDQQTIANIESAIPQSNIGFKMLRQMGYTPGSALGKEGSGLSKPVGIEIRRGRAGLGREDPVKEKLRREEERMKREVERVCTKRRSEEELMADFGCRVKDRWRSRRVVVNFRKAEAVLAQLENREPVDERKNEGNEGEDEKEEEEEEEEITEEDLEDILMKLRDEYKYCLFCGCQYESMDALLSDCPGTNEDDH